MIVKAPARTVAVGMQQLGNGRTVVNGNEISLGFFVMASVKERSQSSVSAAAAPARSGRDKSG